MSLIVELEIPKLCERNYGNRKQTSSHNEDDPPSHKFGKGHDWSTATTTTLTARRRKWTWWTKTRRRLDWSKFQKQALVSSLSSTNWRRLSHCSKDVCTNRSASNKHRYRAVRKERGEASDKVWFARYWRLGGLWWYGPACQTRCCGILEWIGTILWNGH